MTTRESVADRHARLARILARKQADRHDRLARVFASRQRRIPLYEHEEREERVRELECEQAAQRQREARWDRQAKERQCAHFGHKFMDDVKECLRCGEPKEVKSPDAEAIELYQQERARRPPLKRLGVTRLACPKCGSEALVTCYRRRPKKIVTKSRPTRCTECEYEWRTHSREAFGGTRQVEVRG